MLTNVGYVSFSLHISRTTSSPHFSLHC